MQLISTVPKHANATGKKLVVTKTKSFHLDPYPMS